MLWNKNPKTMRNNQSSKQSGDYLERKTSQRAAQNMYYMEFLNTNSIENATLWLRVSEDASKQFNNSQEHGTRKGISTLSF